MYCIIRLLIFSTLYSNLQSLKFKSILISISLCISGLFYAQCPQVDIFLFTQEEVDNFINAYPSCEFITGDLIIGGTVNDISKLNKIKRIDGSLVIMETEITTIANFEGLDFILGDLYFEHNDSLEAIEGLNQLTNVGGDLVISTKNGGLKTISGFEKLERIGGNFTVSRNEDLTSFTGFSSLVNAEGWFTISDNERLPNLPDFDSLKLIGNNLTIENNSSLTIIDGFAQLESIMRSFSIRNNSNLVTLAGFGQLKNVVFVMQFTGLNLSSIPEFNRLISVGGAIDIGPTEVLQINGFNNLEVVGDINPNLGYLTFNSNEKLQNILGFSNLRELKGGFNLLSNTALSGLLGLQNLTDIGSLTITNCGSLTNLNGLNNLFNVGNEFTDGLKIMDNILLTDCSAICNLLQNGNVKGLITIDGNPSQCSSEFEIRDDCNPDFDNDGVLDANDLDDDNDGILDTVEQNGDLSRDSDEDGSPDHRDLDSDNDGCFDVIEAGFIDEDGNGTLGESPDQVDGNGLVIAVNDGYTEPLDDDIDGVFDFQQKNYKNAGEDGSITICAMDNPVDLFAYLTGSPDQGGTWSPNLVNGSGVFDPAFDMGGDYVYSFNNGKCGINEATVTVTVDRSNENTTPSQVLDVCIRSTPINLFEILGIIPDFQGQWYNDLGESDGMFDPSLDVPGLYIYTKFSDELCATEHISILINIEDEYPISEYTIQTSSFKALNFIEVSLGGPNLYEYSLDGFNYQESNRFEGLSSGSYTLHAREINGCGFIKEEIIIHGFPKFFTPNGDGVNDTWELKGELGSKISVFVYNRYGKLLKRINPGGDSWDGTFNGTNLPVDDYWFKAVFSDGEVRIGNFTLKR